MSKYDVKQEVTDKYSLRGRVFNRLREDILSGKYEEYEELKAYACRRLERCRWQEAKPACKRCPTHCYAPAMRQKIREVMRWTGPRMLLYAPVAAIRHWI